MKKLINEIKFSDDGLVPVIAQDVKTDAVLMLAYANREALEKTIATKQAHYYSRSRKKLWRKGEDSGNEQELVSLAIDCDGDAVLYKVKQKGPACHTGNYTCFYRKKSSAPPPAAETPAVRDVRGVGGSDSVAHIAPSPAPPIAPPASLDTITSLAETIADRKKNPQDGSYTNYLFDKGMDKILKKIGEESSEVIIATKNADNAEIAEETADLLYHLLVMFEERGISIGEVMGALGRRR